MLASPAWIGLLAFAVAGIFVAFRLVVAADGHIGAFVVAGARFVTPGPYTRGVPVIAGNGYDGQFYYRIALDPLDWARDAFGTEFDTLARLDRVAYPALVWAMSGGQQRAVPVMMPLVNMMAFGALAGLCAAFARTVGRHPFCGLLMAGFWGFLWSLARDLTELTEAVFLVAGLLALRKGRPVVAGGMFAVAVLAREPALLVAGAVFLARAGYRVRGRLRPAGTTSVAMAPGAADVAWLAPVVVFAGWQLVLKAGTGGFPVLASGQDNVGAPFAGLVQGLVHYVERVPSTASLIWLGEAAALAIVGALAAISLRRSAALLYEKLAWLGALFLGLSLTKGIWMGDVGFRSLDDFFVLSGLLLLSSRARLHLAGLVVALAWSAVALELVLFI